MLFSMLSYAVRTPCEGMHWKEKKPVQIFVAVLEVRVKNETSAEELFQSAHACRGAVTFYWRK